MSASYISYVWIFKSRQLDQIQLFIFCVHKVVNAKLWYLCVSLTPYVLQRYKHTAKGVQRNSSGEKGEGAELWDFHKILVHSTAIFHRKSMKQHKMCYCNLCNLCEYWFLSSKVLDEEIFAVFTYIMTSCKSSILLFTCNRKLRSTLVISLRGIGGSKKSRLLLSSKRPT